MNKRGQLTIFLAICLIIIITAIAFVVNVGLLVKSKINLQNAVDAAAFAGAATQSKLLTNIAYLNWELRNVYKELLFKYYVIGQISFERLKNYSSTSSLDFRQKAFDRTARPNTDRFNIPSVCIHLEAANDICEISDIPGILDFPAVAVPGVSETQQAFIDALIGSKSRDCTQRSMLNAVTAFTWVYGTGDSETYPGAAAIPQALHQRVGAWPAALEIALRVRNLEMQVNRPPIKTITLNDAERLDSANSPINERPLKAFWSAYRNLSKDMREDFVLNEVSPQVVTAAEESLSGLLIAAQSTTIQGIDGDFSPLDKYYLDLRAMPVNLVIFYNALQTTYGSYTTDAGETIASNAECYTTKMGFPVPGYILGFMKNPAVVTYYTVKGESKFRGLFYPFVKDGITIKTLASAKPFGGRIGPHLFDVKEDSDSNSVFELKPLGAVNGGKRPRTCPYLMGLEAPENDHGKPGTPVPSVNGSFWVIDSSDTVGGVPTKIADSVKYGIPNMLYDYEGSISSLANASTCDGNNIHVIRPNTGTSTARDSMGLFDAKQYQLLQKNLAESGYNPGDSSDKLLMAVHLARRPTRYDAANYLIPMAEEQLKNSSPSSENIGIVSPHALPIYASIDSIDLEVYQYRIYAPLAYNGTIYQDGPGGIENTIHNYLNANMKGINIFIASLKEMRERLLLDAQKNTTNTDVYNKSADLFYPANPSHVENCGEGEPYSFASTYNHLFTKDSGIRCNVMPLREAINKYFASRLTGGDSDFVGEYSLPKRTDDLKRTTDLMTAYAPGKRQGVKMEAGEGGVRTIDHPFLGSMRPTLLANRNIYSTKFVHTEKLLPRENDPGDISYYRMNLVNYKDSGGPDITGSTSYSYPNSLLIEDLEDIQNKY